MRGNAKGCLKARYQHRGFANYRAQEVRCNSPPIKLQFTLTEEAAVERYWQKLDKIEVLLKESQDIADKIKPSVDRELAVPTLGDAGA